jgi:hypothetical protein
MSLPSDEAVTTASGLVQRVLRWLRAGYPEGVPQQDYVALLGILRRTLTPVEIERVVAGLAGEAEAGLAIMTPQLVQQRITDVVKGPGLEDDLVRVSARLAAAGWPLGSPVRSDEAGNDDGCAVGGSGLLTRVVDWLRVGYPAGMPAQDFVPLVALLRRRLTDDEVRVVAHGLVEAGVLPSGRVDIGSAVAKVTTEVPSEEDITRVRGYLEAHGWPVDFAG